VFLQLSVDLYEPEQLGKCTQFYLNGESTERSTAITKPFKRLSIAEYFHEFQHQFLQPLSASYITRYGRKLVTVHRPWGYRFQFYLPE
jgi:hypothetical protein